MEGRRIGSQSEDNDKQQDSCQSCDKPFGLNKCAEFVEEASAVS